MIRTLGVLLIWCLCAGSALAHSASRSFSTWQEDGRTVHLVYSIDQVQATLLIPLQSKGTELKTLLAGHLAARLKVSQNRVNCPASLPEPLRASNGSLLITISFTCAKPVQDEGWELRNDAFFDLASTHIHIAAIDNDPQAREFIFTNSHRIHTMRAQNNTALDHNTRNGFWANFTTYIRLGITHILLGFDHLAFVTALILLARNYKDVALLVTGFTLGHSVTLSLAALGFIHPNGAAIEALIGFSIAFIAMEVLVRPGTRDWRYTTLSIAGVFLALAVLTFFLQSALSPLSWLGLTLFMLCYGQLVTSQRLALRASLVLTTAFGLVHGAGFASVLSEAGLPVGRRIAALGGFNIGVEIGQLLVIILWLVGFALLRHLLGIAITTKARTLLSAAIFALGLYWFASRAFI